MPRVKKKGAFPKRKRETDAKYTTPSSKTNSRKRGTPMSHNASMNLHASPSFKRLKGSNQNENGIVDKLLFMDKVNGRAHYKQIRELPIQHDKFVSRHFESSPNKQRQQQEQQVWTVGVGDMVFVKVDKKDQKVTPQKKFRDRKSSAWYPCKCAYAPCQIIAIYQETSGKRGRSGTQSESICLKIRWFHSIREVNTKEATSIGGRDKNWDSFQNASEEIIESDVVQDGSIIPSMIIGRAHLISTLNEVNDLNGKMNIFVGKDGVPTKSYLCTSFLSSEKEISSIGLKTGRCHADSDGQYSKRVNSILSAQTRSSVSTSRQKVHQIFRTARGLRCLHTDDEQFEQVLRSFLNDDVAEMTSFVQSDDDDNNQDDASDDGSNLVDDGSSADEIEDEPVISDNEMKDAQLVDDGSNADDIEDEPAISDDEMKDIAHENVKEDDDEEGNAEYDSNIDEDDDNDNIWTTEPPFHVDVSARKVFYMSIEVTPPRDHFADSKVGEEEEAPAWKVNVGDTVAIHIDPGTLNRRVGNRSSGTILSHPFKVPWWCADIVAIYSDLEEDEAKELKKVIGKNLGPSLKGDQYIHYGDFQVEVRWLYKMEDIPGFNMTRVDRDRSISNGLKELFETDDVDDIGADTILGPCSIHSNPSPELQLDHHSNGMPLVHFYCQRFWSLHRRTLVPSGTLENRAQRGMLYSKYLNRGTQARAAFRALQRSDDDPTDNNKTSDWNHRFRSTISKLTLAEASHDVTSSEVIGRDEQKDQIKSFLASAIHKVNGTELTIEDTAKSTFCLFVGGPPGTGKTASVTSIITHLRKDQSDGNLPEFQFVSLNGMEMRHPFDTYVRLWEAVSSNKEKLTRPKALAKLQLYFSESSLDKNTSGKKNCSQKRRPVVLLVDEIDYLVTKKQTILYNLFDWPMTGYENGSEAQLIVVGISNTLNLPERLHVRLQSRIGKKRCIFSSYSWNDSVSIIEEKLGDSLRGGKSIFNPDAIKFAARKVAAESGDIRKVFQLCKNAAENVLNEIVSGKRSLPASQPIGLKAIGVADVQNAAREMFNSILHLAVSHSTSYQALLLVALAALQRNTGREIGGFTVEEVHTKMGSMANSFGSKKYFPCPQYHMILGMLCPLGEAGVLKLLSANGRTGSFGTSGADTQLSLNMDSFEVLSSFKDTAHYPLAQKFLSITKF